MFRHIKEIKRLSAELRPVLEKQRAAAEESTVRIRVSDRGGLLSPLSPEGTPLISAEAAEFLERSVKMLRPEDTLRIVLTAEDEWNKEQTGQYAAAIRNHYLIELIDAQREARRNLALCIAMLLIGVGVFTAAILLDGRAGDVYLNILDVAAWVFVWEAVDLYFLQRPLLRLRQLRCLKLLKAAISFEDAPEENK